MLMNAPNFKTSSFVILLLLITSSLINAQTSAFDTMQSFEKNRGKANLKNIVAITGGMGQDQPKQWIILGRDPKTKNLMHEYVMKKGGINAERHFTADPEQPLPSAPLPLTQLNIDSPRAFQIANKAANSHNIGFDSVNYLLRIHHTSPAPVWTLTLVDQQKKNRRYHLYFCFNRKTD